MTQEAHAPPLFKYASETVEMTFWASAVHYDYLQGLVHKDLQSIIRTLSEGYRRMRSLEVLF